MAQDQIEAAQIRHDTAEAALEIALKSKHGDDWEEHLSEYHWDMPTSFTAIAYRTWYAARIALDATKLVGEKQTHLAEIVAKANELKALFAKANPDATRPTGTTVWGGDVDLAVMRFTRDLCDRA